MKESETSKFSDNNEQTIYGNKHIIGILRCIAENQAVKNMHNEFIKYTTVSLAASYSNCSISNECFRDAFRIIVANGLCYEIKKEESHAYHDLFPPKSSTPNLLNSFPAIYIITNKGETILVKWYEFNSVLFT